MKYREQMIKDIYTISGMLECLTCMQGQTITEAMTAVLADCVDRLEIIGAGLQNEAVIKCDENGITITCHT